MWRALYSNVFFVLFVYLEHQRRTYAYGARDENDYNTDESEDESEDEKRDRDLKKWFLSEIDKHRNELEKKDEEGMINNLAISASLPASSLLSS